MTAPRSRAGAALVAVLAGLAGWVPGTAEAAEVALPPSPYAILEVALGEPPPLDAPPLCLPADDTRFATPLGALERHGASTALIALDDAARDTEPDFATAAAVLRASLAARHRAAGRETRRALRAAARGATTARGRACAWLEFARLELVDGRLPEARVHALRALRAFDETPVPDWIARTADHYRAESLYRSGQTDAARPLYQSLSTGKTQVASAARLRLADLDYQARPGPDTRRRLEAVLSSDTPAPTTLDAWAARIAEWALVGGDTESALEWLDRAPGDLGERERAALEIRRADALYLSGRGDDGETLLRELANEASTEPIRQLATVRLIDLESPAGDRPRAHLERAARSALPGLSIYARSLLADRLSAAGDDETALDMLVAIVYENAPPGVVGPLGDRLDEVIGGLAAKRDCVGLLAVLGGRRTLLLEHASVAEPFLRLGDCYFELGMSRSAREVYRSANRRFGPELTRHITLRSARADHAIGEVDSARAAARSNLQLITIPTRSWRLLYGEILIEDGRPDDAIPVLVPVVRDVAKRALTGGEAVHAVWLLAKAASEHGANTELRASLRAGIDVVAKSAPPESALAETLLIVADLHRFAGDDEHARDFYAAAMSRLQAGPLHSMAAFWLGSLASDIDQTRATWGGADDGDDVWARLVDSELGLGRTRASLGREQPAWPPATRTAQGGDL